MEKEANPIIEISNLTKRYDDLVAVDNLNLTINKGEIFGLLGPNGAGKTTTILMMLGLSESTEGSVLINGYNSTNQPIKVKEIVGYLQDNVGFYEELSGKENLRLIAKFNNKNDDKNLDEILKRVGLYDVRNKKVGKYSRGMKQRLGLADILVKDPEVVILDEPTLGLDPEGIEQMLNLITQLAKVDGRTVLISSHLLYQIQKICDRVGIFVSGKMLAKGPIETLADQVFNNDRYSFELKIDKLDKEIISSINNIIGVIKTDIEDDTIKIISKTDIRYNLMKLLANNNRTILHLKRLERELEDIYRKYFEREEG